VRFLIDESTGPTLGAWLREAGHEVYSVYEQARGVSDQEVLKIANAGRWILITNDKDFGERIFREGEAHQGVILLRLRNERSANKINAVQRVLTRYADRLEGRFVVVSEDKIRITEI
jgi:predicted nuclease of predicted toxin-antitoxin system